ncbi:OmpA family protein [Paracoccus saliphilus]|uniref:OmpA family protein n=1 Tax=Paracoccus saliphilus TaxID=405559 RepID=A0AA46A408_9RHOB|nr:OmpA family protein [Paracoccus saliphilus]WCR03437.1 OmpA family protein [Paracoccus saliphilus]SIS53587.1 OmpA-OmpF porin, OOP family [Paracoccus saliphilus]
MASSRKRVSTSLATLVVLAGIGGLSWFGAREAADFMERRSGVEVRNALADAGQDWVAVRSDGLQVLLSGTAPTEVERFRAVTQAGTVIDSSRIVDEMTVMASDALAPPAFKVELLRNDDGISLIGLVPASTDRAALVHTLQSETAAPKVTDLLENADYPAPEHWDEAIRYGLRVAQMTPQAKISIEAGNVAIEALTESRAEKGRLEKELSRSLPDSVELNTDISAPRPAIAPFTLRFMIDDQGARFDACAADDEEGRERILAAAVRAGVKGTPGCTLALGAPAPEWADAVVAAIGAVAALKRGTVTLSDADIALTVPAGVERSDFDKVVTNLEQALPPVFSLNAHLDEAPDAPTGPAEFFATMSAGREMTMRGRIGDQQMYEAVDSFARARFTSVQDSLRSDGDTPGGWTVRVIAGLEALDGLEKGAVKVSRNTIELSGDSGDPRAAEHAAAALSKRLGAGARYQLSIRYDRRLDPALALPDGDQCVDRLNIIMSEAAIGFEPNKSTIAGDPTETLERMSEVMADCADFQIEAGGHTDSQGSEGFNADLSRSRAQALVSAMSDAGIDVTNMTSRGYGESQPIATNDTEEGREENRRIEFRLISEQPVRTEPLPAPVTVEGTTGEAMDAEPDVEVRMHVADDPEAGEEVAGPEMPSANDISGAAPATVGASEEFQTLDEREENIRLPVQTPDDGTPRPAPRPDAIEGEGESDEGETQQSEATEE